MNDQRAREGLDHLQSAALEVIAAVRAFLDVAEDLVRDPSQVAAVVQGLADNAQPSAASSADPAEGGVTRIRVS